MSVEPDHRAGRWSLHFEEIDKEIAIVSEFLPQKMDRTKLVALIDELLTAAPEGKAAKGYVMKHLNQDHRGTFDNVMAGEILTEKTA